MKPWEEPNKQHSFLHDLCFNVCLQVPAPFSSEMGYDVECKQKQTFFPPSSFWSWCFITAIESKLQHHPRVAWRCLQRQLEEYSDKVLSYCVCACACLCQWRPSVASSMTLYVIIWDSVSHWPWSSPGRTGWLTSPRILLSLPLQPWDCRCMKPDFLHSFGDLNSDPHDMCSKCLI